MTHPRHRLDDLIHSPVRLSVMAALRAADAVHFGLLRDTLEVSDSLLSKHLAALESAGYIEVTKGYAGRRPRTWYSLSSEGRAAFDAYVVALREIVDASDPSDPLPRSPA
ncbi:MULTISPECIES: winged helix-turn-helix domain-containing protein [Cellulosimicrobium]|uniref:Transcriptional regulator n=1 Tax=Cellulosimicrobium sp. ES-005 TaxID=3163031 RepID=A0AAU8G1B6_9MICO|nr:transcriptional regulator [Cellulosimicrobium cellulans]MCO7272807.1 transcriptional regulator [Cellulosimicrobium cellulans]